MKTINIKGNPYVQVNERIKEFRKIYPTYGLITDIVELNQDFCTIMARVVADDGRTIATGLAREERDDKSSMVNRTSFVENCETSAWGRALGNLGIGIDESIASADEVSMAIASQERSQAQNNERQPKNEQSYGNNAEMTLEEAYEMKTVKGTAYGALKDENLEYIIEHSKVESCVKAAKMILEDRRTSEDLMPLGDDDVPWN